MGINGRPIKFKVRIIVEPDEDEYHAYCPALKGLHVPGKTVEEAFENAKEAVKLYLESLIEDGDPIPLGIIEEEKPRLLHIKKRIKPQSKDLQIALR